MDSWGTPEVEFKEIVPCLKFETQLKHGCFHLKLLLRGSCHFSIAPLYRFVEGFWLPLECSIQANDGAFHSKPVLVYYKDTSVHYRVQYNSSIHTINSVIFADGSFRCLCAFLSELMW